MILYNNKLLEVRISFILDLLFFDNHYAKTNTSHIDAFLVPPLPLTSRSKCGFHITITLNRSALSLKAGLLPLRDSSSHLNWHDEPKGNGESSCVFFRRAWGNMTSHALSRWPEENAIRKDLLSIQGNPQSLFTLQTPAWSETMSEPSISLFVC